jgi:hypothetical protein
VWDQPEFPLSAMLGFSSAWVNYIQMAGFRAMRRLVFAVNKGHNNRILCGDYLAVCGEYGYYLPQEVR